MQLLAKERKEKGGTPVMQPLQEEGGERPVGGQNKNGAKLLRNATVKGKTV